VANSLSVHADYLVPPQQIAAEMLFVGAPAPPMLRGRIPGERMSRFYQEGAKQRAACFANPPVAVLLPGLHDRRIEAGIAGHLFGPRETMGIP